METEKRQAELPMLSKKFGSDYFERLYRGSGDKNPPAKISAYLSVLERTVLSVRKGQSFREEKLKLLDIGCGYGRFLKAAEAEFETYGIDPSSFVIDTASKYATNTKFETASVFSYRPTKLFDVITCFDVLEHVPDVEKSVLKIKSWLKPKGIFFCVIPVYDGVFGTIGGRLDRDTTHLHKLSRRVWLKMFKKNFTVLETQGIFRYSFSKNFYFHLMKRWLFHWGQAILVVMRK